MNHAQHNTIVNFIWGIADDVLRDVYVRGKYRDVILPMTVIRRLDCLLEPTKEEVLKRKKLLDEAGIVNQEVALRTASRQAFYNTSEFTLRRLLDSPKQLRANFTDYLDGFSTNVGEIIEKFDFRNQLKKLDDADALGHLIAKFIDPNINLSPNPVFDGQGNVKLPGLDNHGMGYVFEELIRRFNEENNEEAGEHFTPREVVRLMANLIFLPIKDQIESGTYLVYDGACGTGGMLTVSEEVLITLAKEHGKEIAIHLYGQEINAETYAISKADLLLKGEGEEADNLKFGSTLSIDAFPSLGFDFMLSNPPYGKSWKTDLDRLCGGNKEDIRDSRFVVEHDGDSEFNLVTRSSDGQLMFLVNLLSKMKRTSPLGSRIAEVHNGSSLFTGDAGQGESNIRRWIIENDWLEAIVALPLNMFYNTGIATYVWVLTNRKPAHRKDKVQLIDATGWFAKLRKNLGQKNCELTDTHIRQICDTFLAFEETQQSKIFPNEAFGYWKITVERPLRLCVDLSQQALERFRKVCEEAKETPIANVVARVVTILGSGPHLNFNIFLDAVKNDGDAHDVKLTAKRERLLMNELAEKDETAAPVVKKRTKLKKDEWLPEGSTFGGAGFQPARSQEGCATIEMAAPLERTTTSAQYGDMSPQGKYLVEQDGARWLIEYEPDADLRDTEQVPLLEEGGIEAFFRREVLPHVPDAWIDESKTVIGYEIPFTRRFYKYRPLRSLAEITADIRALEVETEGLLEQITEAVGGGA
ncbi:MAG TPA: class I SAM-dependent DNA methyltransferase [Candidatus Binatia bacterium]|nr:class I SAM-dependent DNA methyltransferase [Candidatus Binatia bacterium]